MTATTILLYGWAILSPLFAALWLRQVRTRDANSVDVGWAAGLGALALACAALQPGALSRRLLVGAMGAVWSSRLAVHLFVDRVKGKPEDGRYARLRESWGADANRNFFVLYQGQAALDAALGLPFAALCARTGPLGPFDATGAAIWAIAVAGEAASDRQLVSFRAVADNKGKTCRAGLWRFSRHPNYFFEWLHWLAYAAMAPADWRVWTSPALMLFFLFKISGIPATEEQAVRSRGDDYRKYQKTTSMFVPWFPRRNE